MVKKACNFGPTQAVGKFFFPAPSIPLRLWFCVPPQEPEIMRGGGGALKNFPIFQPPPPRPPNPWSCTVCILVLLNQSCFFFQINSDFDALGALLLCNVDEHVLGEEDSSTAQLFRIHYLQNGTFSQVGILRLTIVRENAVYPRSCPLFCCCCR